jgi:hypothetical protein
MPAFKAGPHEWKVNLTIGLLGDIKRETGIDLAHIFTDGEKLAEVMFSDTLKIVDAIWLICEPQATAAGVTQEQFLRTLDGEALDAATHAMLLGMTDFFPKARGREAMKRNLPRAMQRMTEKSNEVMEKGLRSMFSDTPGNSPESSASTPAG